MKTKLLKKVRKKYRIIKNDNNEFFIQGKVLFWWESISIWDLYMIEKLYHYSDIMGKFRSLLRYKYDKYTRTNRILMENKKKTSVFWYNHNKL